MVRQECSAHYSEISIDGQRILSVRFVPNTIKFAFASAKAFLNYELRITNYEFGRRPLNCNVTIQPSICQSEKRCHIDEQSERW